MFSCKPALVAAGGPPTGTAPGAAPGAAPTGFPQAGQKLPCTSAPQLAQKGISSSWAVIAHSRLICKWFFTTLAGPLESRGRDMAIMQVSDYGELGSGVCRSGYGGGDGTAG